MQYDYKKKEIKIDKVLSNLDKFVIDFVSLLDEYVIVSGYVSILLGRTRATEDVDLLIPKMTKSEFLILWNKIISKKYWCLNTPDIDEAFDLLEEHSIRFAKENEPVPNIEFKIIKNSLDQFSYDNKIKIFFDSIFLYISPIELQVAYKLYLGTEKDIEDARHIFRLFDEKINKVELLHSFEKLKLSANKIKLLK